ncbi:MAG: hypothetical protein PHV34_06570 [Verrucomicrobiae bacterium]|nr:hypothetical protein [Verrucomicrobiae bacterium]
MSLDSVDTYHWLQTGRRTNPFLVFLWCVLGVMAIQAANSPADWGLAWVGLGAATLAACHLLRIRMVLVLTAPVFLAILSYSITTIYLSREAGAFDLSRDRGLNGAMWMAWMGMAAYQLGLFMGLRMPSRILQGSPVRVNMRDAVVMTLFGFFCNEVLLRVTPFSLRNVVYMFGCCAPAGLFLILHAFGGAKQAGGMGWRFALWLAGVGIWFIGSVKSGIFGSTLLIMVFLVAPYIERSRWLLAAVIMVCFSMAPLCQDIKQDYRKRLAEEEPASRQTVAEVVMENFRKFFVEGDMNTYRKGITALADRLCTFDIWYRVKQHLDTQRDYAGGRTVKDALLASFIPRFLWPDKPVTGGASDLAIRYADMRIQEGTSVGVGAISEFAINGGGMAVGFGMLMFGLFGGMLLISGWLDRVQPLGVIMAVLAFANMVRPETNLSDALGGAIRVVFVWGVARWWVLRRHHKTIFRRRAPGREEAGET